MVAARPRRHFVLAAASSWSVRDAARLAGRRPSAPPIMNDGIDHARSEPGFARRDVAHRREQHRIEGHAGAEAEQDHARQNVDAKFPSTGARAKQHRGRSRPAAGRPPAAARMPKRMTIFADRPSENAAMIRFAGRNARPTCERAVAEHQLQVERRDEEPREHRRRPQHADDIRGRDVAQPEQASGISGACTRASMARKSASSTPRRRAGPSVCAEVQPASLPFTIA